MGHRKYLKDRLFISFLILLISFTICVSVEAAGIDKKNASKSGWSLAAYNFGSLGKLSPEAQIDLLKKTGYKGIILSCETKEDFQNLDRYFEKAGKIKDFKIEAVFERYNFTDSTSRKERWRKVVDKISGTGAKLWIIFGKKAEGITDGFIEAKLSEMVSYSASKKVEVILYPHSKCYIASAETALPFIEKIGHPNLKLAVHLCHEIRAGNGSRIDQVFDRVKDHIGAVTLAGTDSVADFSAPKLMDSSTIMPLGRGNYDLNRFLEPLRNSGYKGVVGFINFKIEEDPETYLDASMKVWRTLTKQ
ncbi:MAG: sugar phosphate isomerase/epimerase [Prolixibacteraceae bacterium]|nr:sugar phosphate isomerase/epimerase [Prolixibacteraceae bacterium]